MYPGHDGGAITESAATAEEIASLTGHLRQWARAMNLAGDPRDGATIMTETLGLIGMPSMAEPIKRLVELIGPDGAQPRRSDAI